MPFTISHVVAILPLARRPLVGSALAVGAMSPDLLYFVAMHPYGGPFTHSPWGVLAIDLPLSLALLAMFHLLLTEPLLAVLPAGVRARLAPLAERVRRTPRTAASALAVVGSVLIGAATHVAWDACTHHHGWVVTRMPMLRQQVWSGMPLYHFLQLGCTILGFAVLIWWSARWLRTAKPRPVPARYAPPSSPALTTVAMVAGVIAITGANVITGLARYYGVSRVAVTEYLATGGGEPLFRVDIAAARASIGLTTGTFLMLTAYGIFRMAKRSLPQGS